MSYSFSKPSGKRASDFLNHINANLLVELTEDSTGAIKRQKKKRIELKYAAL